LASYACVRHTLRPRLTGDPALRRFGFAVVGTNLANWAVDNVDRLIVNRYWGAAALGEFTAASNLSRAPANLVVASAQSVTLAAASRVQDDPRRLTRGYLGVSALVWLLCAPTFVWLALHADVVVQTLYGQRWQHAAPLFAALCAGLPFYALLSVAGPTLWAVGAVRSEFKSQVFIAFSLMVGFVALIGTPLHLAVWLVPALSVLRLVLVYRSLARRLDLGLAKALTALTGGTLLAALAGLGWVCTVALSMHGLAAAAASAAVTVVLAAMALRWVPQVVVPMELLHLIQARARESAAVREACRWMGLSERPS
jgi:lipopolysaccharide exporter